MQTANTITQTYINGSGEVTYGDTSTSESMDQKIASKWGVGSGKDNRASKAEFSADTSPPQPIRLGFIPYTALNNSGCCKPMRIAPCPPKSVMK